MPPPRSTVPLSYGTLSKQHLENTKCMFSSPRSRCPLYNSRRSWGSRRAGGWGPQKETCVFVRVWEGCLETQGLPDWHKHTYITPSSTNKPGRKFACDITKRLQKAGSALNISVCSLDSFQARVFQCRTFPRSGFVPENVLKVQLHPADPSVYLHSLVLFMIQPPCNPLTASQQAQGDKPPPCTQPIRLQDRNRCPPTCGSAAQRARLLAGGCFWSWQRQNCSFAAGDLSCSLVAVGTNAASVEISQRPKTKHEELIEFIVV